MRQGSRGWVTDVAATSEDVARVTLLHPDGTPIPEASRWDRKLRVDGQLEYAPYAKTLRVVLADGEPGLWQWIADHTRDEVAPTGLISAMSVVRPIAVETFMVTATLGWVHHRMPRLNLHDVGEKPVLDPGAWPVWTWQGVVNENWPEESYRDTALGWSTLPEGRPVDAPPPLTEDELETLS